MHVIVNLSGGFRQGHPKIVSNRFAEMIFVTRPLSAGTSTDPADLTARARPEARPDRRAADLRERTRHLPVSAAKIGE